MCFVSCLFYFYCYLLSYSPRGPLRQNTAEPRCYLEAIFLLLKLAAHAPNFNASVILLATGQIESGGVLEYEPIMSVYLRHLQ